MTQHRNKTAKNSNNTVRIGLANYELRLLKPVYEIANFFAHDSLPLLFWNSLTMCACDGAYVWFICDSVRLIQFIRRWTVLFLGIKLSIIIAIITATNTLITTEAMHTAKTLLSRVFWPYMAMTFGLNAISSCYFIKSWIF